MINIQCVEVLSRTSKVLVNLGALPTKKPAKFQTTKSCLNVFLVILVLYITCHDIINGIRTKNIELINHMICFVLIPVIIVVVKMSSFTVNKNSFLSLLDVLESDAFNVHNHNLNRHIQLIDRIAKFVLVYILTAMCVTEFAFGIFPLFTKMKLAIPAPFALGRYTVFYSMFHTFITVYLIISSTFTNLFYLTLMGISVAQLKILHENLLGIFDKGERTTDIYIIYNRVDKLLRKCIVLHKTINM